MKERRFSTELPEPLEAWLLSSLRGDFRAFPEGAPDCDLERLIQFTDDAGIQPFLRHRLKETGALDLCPPALREAFERRYLMEVVVHSLRKKELLRVVQAFDQAQIRALILKGAALAHLIYPEPGLRTCCDIDALIDPKKAKTADEVLRSLGYERVEKIYFETSYKRVDEETEHSLDLHRRLSNSPFFSGKFDFEELYERSAPVETLKPAVRTLGDVDSLIHACIHIAGHREWQRLIWLADIYLLFGRLSDEQIVEFVHRAIDRKCGQVCLEALRVAGEVYVLKLDHPAMKPLIDRSSAHHRKSDPSAYLLQPFRDNLHEFFHLMLGSQWGDRFKLLWSVFFPPLSELSGRYDTESRFKIPFIYLYRIVVKLPVILIFGSRRKSA